MSYFYDSNNNKHNSDNRFSFGNMLWAALGGVIMSAFFLMFSLFVISALALIVLLWPLAALYGVVHGIWDHFREEKSKTKKNKSGSNNNNSGDDSHGNFNSR